MSDGQHWSSDARWSALFGDLEAQFAGEQAAEDVDALAGRSRYEAGRRTLVERLRASSGNLVRLGLPARDPISLVIAEVGPDWLLGEETAPAGAECLVRLGAISWIEGLGRYADAREPGRVWARLDLRHAIRGLAQQRAQVSVGLSEKHWEQGTFDRIYADHADLALHAAGEPRRPGSLTGVRAIPFAAISVIRRLA
jgi:hypothetical protein